MSELPYICKSPSGISYSLHFKIPIKEYEEMKSKLSKVDHAKFEKFAKLICEEHGVKTYNIGYPKLKWSSGGELECIVIGTNCACISKEARSNEVGYFFHNIDWPNQALAALEILARFYTSLSGL